MRNWLTTVTLAALASTALTAPALSADPVRIGFITTLSTPAGYIGEDLRDAFNLVINKEGGKLGGVPVELLVEDDGLKPANAKQIAERMAGDGVKLFSGVNFSNVLAAVAPTVLDAGAFYVSLNPGPSVFAGEGCRPNYFVASYQNDSYHEAGGLAANELGYKRMVILAPNYQAGRDALAGFKRTYKGEVLAEIYTKLDQTDFSVEFARLRSMKPDAIYQFHPGGAGINFAKQYANSGVAKDIPMVLPMFSMDQRMLGASGEASKGYYVAANWSAGLDNPANKDFVAAFEAAYNRTPTVYAAQAYDTARLIGSALQAVDGNLDDTEGFRAAMMKADFASVRGNFRFGPNQHAIQDWYLMKIAPGADGKLAHVVERKVADGMPDSYAASCKF
ncbi:ABC transporter substrate-binding protein (plasmid) [Tistrella bauzanensis]|uniref:ABC transporter substrate-binding protein n=1 Tax=Tistrella TaxID=171436 RepID=UPI0031F6703B